MQYADHLKVRAQMPRIAATDWKGPRGCRAGQPLLLLVSLSGKKRMRPTGKTLIRIQRRNSARKRIAIRTVS